MESLYPLGTNGVNRLRDYEVDGSQAAPPSSGMATIADRVNELVKRLDGRSLRSFEDEHGIPNGTIGKLARGDRKEPAALTVRKVALAFGVSQAWLMGEEEEPASAPPERTYHPNDRYPSREQAIALLRGIMPEQVLDAVKLHALKSAEDPGIDFWLETIRTLARHRADMAKHVEVMPEETAPKRVR